MPDTTAPFGDVIETLGSDGSTIKSFLSFVEENGENQFLPGDTFAFPGLKEWPGLRFVSSEHKELEEDSDMERIEVILHVDKARYSVEDSEEKIKSDIEDWFLDPDNSQRRRRSSESLVIESCESFGSEPDYSKYKVMILIDCFIGSDLIGDVQDSSFYHKFWNYHMESIVKEGVCYLANRIPSVLVTKLRRQVTELGLKTSIDYHPNSNDIVRDLVHPALYPYIRGVTKINKKLSDQSLCNLEESIKGIDFWGRKYEDSKFQWLPTPFKISENGKCSIQSYINNLDRGVFSDFYDSLQELFEIFLPYFEEVWSYCKAVQFFAGDDSNEDEVESVPPLVKEKVSFNDQTLQIIVKVVEYTLQPDQTYEGVWHAEGMSHENIVMTGIYFLDRNASLSGGDLRFKRPFTVDERNRVFFNIQQCRPMVVNKFAQDGFVPLGHFPTSEGYMLVFPNCHIHKIAKMMNTDPSKPSSRRIVVFFFVNPEKRIIDTTDVDPQQNVISLDMAKKYRLELMAERKYDKEKLNVRDIELCEH